MRPFFSYLSENRSQAGLICFHASSLSERIQQGKPLQVTNRKHTCVLLSRRQNVYVLLFCTRREEPCIQRILLAFDGVRQAGFFPRSSTHICLGRYLARFLCFTKRFLGNTRDVARRRVSIFLHQAEHICILRGNRLQPNTGPNNAAARSEHLVHRERFRYAHKNYALGKARPPNKSWCSSLQALRDRKTSPTDTPCFGHRPPPPLFLRHRTPNTDRASKPSTQRASTSSQSRSFRGTQTTTTPESAKKTQDPTPKSTASVYTTPTLQRIHSGLPYIHPKGCCAKTSAAFLADATRLHPCSLLRGWLDWVAYRRPFSSKRPMRTGDPHHHAAKTNPCPFRLLLAACGKFRLRNHRKRHKRKQRSTRQRNFHPCGAGTNSKDDQRRQALRCHQDLPRPVAPITRLRDRALSPRTRPQRSAKKMESVRSMFAHQSQTILVHAWTGRDLRVLACRRPRERRL